MAKTTEAKRERSAAAELLRSVEEALTKLQTRRLTDHRIHQARRALKRARAALRLLRPAIGDRTFRLENVTLRDAGRLLSPLRDARALLETLERLLTRAPKRLVEHDLSALRLSLERDLIVARRTLRVPSQPIAQCIGLLQAHRRRLQTLPQADAAQDVAALSRIYRRGRKGLAHATETRTTEALHDWRKEVKYLVNGLEVFQPKLGRRLEKTLLCADDVGDLLGEDHDLAVLERRVASSIVTGVDADARKALLRVIQNRRSKLQARAIERGEQLYRRKAKRFARTLEGAVSGNSARPATQQSDGTDHGRLQPTVPRRRKPADTSPGEPNRVSPANAGET